MNLTLFGAIALMAFVSDSNGGAIGGGFGGPAQFGGGPAGFGGPGGFGGMFAPPAAAAGKMAGQEASKNAVDLAVNSAMSKVNITELPQELQVTEFKFFYMHSILFEALNNTSSLFILEKIAGGVATSDVGYRIWSSAM